LSFRFLINFGRSLLSPQGVFLNLALSLSDVSFFSRGSSLRSRLPCSKRSDLFLFDPLFFRTPLMKVSSFSMSDSFSWRWLFPAHRLLLFCAKIVSLSCTLSCRPAFTPDTGLLIFSHAVPGVRRPLSDRLQVPITSSLFLSLPPNPCQTSGDPFSRACHVFFVPLLSPIS